MRIIPTAMMSVGVVLSGAAYASAETQVALELVLAVDASASVNEKEYELQVFGYVHAFQDPEVVAAINALGPAGIAVTYVEWSSRFGQVQSVGWTHVYDDVSANLFASSILQNTKKLQASGTAIGEAILYSVDLFPANGFSGERKIIDVSADDRYNAGSTPSYARGIAVRNQITVNGLAVDPTGVLTTYFRDNVIGGVGAFVLTANSFDDFAAAIKRKLLRELGGQGAIAHMPAGNLVQVAN